MPILNVIILIAAICDLFLGLLVLLKDPKKRLNLFFGVFCLICSLWIIANFLLFTFPSAFWLQSTYSFGALAASASIFWGLEITNKKITKTKAVVFGSLGVLFFIACYFGFKMPPLTSSDLNQLYASGIEVKNSIPFFICYIAYVTSMILYTISLLISGYRHAPNDIVKKQLGYILVGIVLNGLFIIVASLILPFFGFYAVSSLFDSPSSLFLIAFSAAAIMRYRLFEIKVILTEALVLLMALLLLFLPFMMQTVQLIAFTAGLFLIFCFCGYLLIKGAIREAKQKDVLEQKVAERTADLEKAKNLAEQQTAEVTARKEELERFYHLTVGRELKMVELKKKIKELQQTNTT
ncbi:MAG: hypothetical protein NTZ42_01025 [Candidatus Gribaldobacteria bacterium]|nr:hypothetical protein [Candidatus Gribaldobacteria bacterium]